MDVYVGFGLLSAAVVVLLFIIFDTWLKSRQTRMAEMIPSDDGTADDSEFMPDAESHDLAQFEVLRDDLQDQEPVHTVLRDDLQPHQDDREPLVHPEAEERVLRDGLRPPQDDRESRLEGKPSPKTAPSYDNLLILSVMAKHNSRFASYDLLQAIATIGMQYGEMNIFHYYQQTMTGKVTLFSLASANKPGEFDLDNMGAFSCTGLVFFMNIARVPDPQNGFRLMLETAERLADYLDGELHADPSTPWNEKLVWQYQQKIMQYKTMARYETV